MDLELTQLLSIGIKTFALLTSLCVKLPISVNKATESNSKLSETYIDIVIHMHQLILIYKDINLLFKNFLTTVAD